MGEETFLVGVWLSRAQPLECFLPKKIEDKTGENKSGLKHPCCCSNITQVFSFAFFFFSLISKLGFAQFLLWCLFPLWFSFSVLSFSVQLLLSFFNFLLWLFLYTFNLGFLFFFSFFFFVVSILFIQINFISLHFFTSNQTS